MRIKRNLNWVVMFVCACFLTGCDIEKEIKNFLTSLGLMSDPNSDGEDASAKLATLKNVKNEVKTKRHDSLSFEDSAEGTLLLEDDSISTLAASSAVIKFNDGNMIKVEGDSLLVIHKFEKNENGENVINVTLEGGAIQSRCEKNAQTKSRLKISAGKSTAESEEACSELGLRKNKDGTEEVWVNKGKISVKRGKEIKKIGAGERASFGNIRNSADKEQEFGVTSADKKASEKLTPTQIDLAIQQIKKRIRDCYLSEVSSIRKEVSISGVIKVLGKDGMVSDVTLQENASTDPALAKCTGRLARMARFPKFTQESDQVNFSIILN